MRKVKALFAVKWALIFVPANGGGVVIAIIYSKISETSTADEPTGALDSKTSAEIMETLLKLNENGKTIIIVTHDPQIAKLCRRVVSISDGRLTE